MPRDARYRPPQPAGDPLAQNTFAQPGIEHGGKNVQQRERNKNNAPHTFCGPRKFMPFHSRLVIGVRDPADVRHTPCRFVCRLGPRQAMLGACVSFLWKWPFATLNMPCYAA